MGRISIMDLKPGMILASDVKDRNNRVLLVAGGTITEKHIKIFKIWGVHDADIQGLVQENMDTPEPVEEDPAVRRESEEMTRERFRHAGTSHPVLKELHRLASMRRMRRKKENRNG